MQSQEDYNIAQRKESIPKKYRADICSNTGLLISFSDHKIFPWANLGENVYVGGFGFAEAIGSDRQILSDGEFYDNLKNSVICLDKRKVKPSSPPLRFLKNMGYRIKELFE